MTEYNIITFFINVRSNNQNGSCYIDKDLKSQDIAIKDAKIIKIGKIEEEAKEIFDAKGLTVLPGCIDTQTHFREPGSTDTEDLNSGSRAAIVGGITSVLRCLIRIHLLLLK